MNCFSILIVLYYGICNGHTKSGVIRQISTQNLPNVNKTRTLFTLTQLKKDSIPENSMFKTKLVVAFDCVQNVLVIKKVILNGRFNRVSNPHLIHVTM
jgi:hypothetical protein